MAVSVDVRLDELRRDLAAIPRDARTGARKAIRQAVRIIGLDARREIRSGTKTGRLYASVVSAPKTDYTQKTSHRASAPGEAPASISGGLARSVKWEVNKSITSGRVYTSHYHAHLMEYGTDSRITSRGVNRGRVEPRPFLGPALERNKEAAAEKMADAVDAALDKNLRKGRLVLR